MKTEEEYENEDAHPDPGIPVSGHNDLQLGPIRIVRDCAVSTVEICSRCRGEGDYDRFGCWQCGLVAGGVLQQDEIARLRAIIANRDRKLRDWAKRADQYDVAVGTVIKMITDELLEDHG